MRTRFLRRFLTTRPVTLIVAVLLLKAILLLLLLPRLQILLASNYGLGFADDYDVLARSLSEGLGYRFFADTAPTMMREPGYPLLLAGLFHLFGHTLAVAQIANLIFSCVAAISVSRLARRITGNEWVVRLAPLLFLVHPGIVLAEARGGVECLFIMLLLFFMESLYRALASGRWRDYVVSGLLLGLSATVRSTALLFPPFLLGYFWFWQRARPAVGVMLGRIAVLCAAAALMLVPWTVRNYQLVHALVPTASVAGVSAYAGYHICTHLGFDNRFIDVDADAGAERARIAREAGLRFKPMANNYYLYFYDTRDELAFNHLLGDRVTAAYLKDPLLLASCSSKNLFHFWFSGKNWFVTGINMIIQLPYLILGCAGLIIGLRGNRRAGFAPLLLFIGYTLCVYLPILAQARYSLHLMPFLAILAAVPLGAWLARTTSGNIRTQS